MKHGSGKVGEKNLNEKRMIYERNQMLEKDLRNESMLKKNV